MSLALNAFKFLWLPCVVLVLFAFNGINLFVFLFVGLFKILFYSMTAFSGIFGLLLSSIVGAFVFEKIENQFIKEDPQDDKNSEAN